MAWANSIDGAGSIGPDIPAAVVPANPGWQAEASRNDSPAPAMTNAHAKPIRQRIEIELIRFSRSKDQRAALQVLRFLLKLRGNTV